MFGWSNMHAMCWPALAIPGQDIEMTGPALRHSVAGHRPSTRDQPHFLKLKIS
jgi:hypothetical protein